MLISDLLLNYLECLKLKRHTIRVSINSNRQHINCYKMSNSIKLAFWEFEKHIIINLKTTIYGQKQKGKVLNYFFNVFIDSDLLLLSKYCNKLIINSIIKRELYIILLIIICLISWMSSFSISIIVSHRGNYLEAEN